ncbi:MAG TPA: transposase, partial [Anaerolineales bacterium]
FGSIHDAEMDLNDAGRMIAKWWQELPNKFPIVDLGTFIVMPNHFHGIIQITETVGADLRVCPENESKQGGHIGPPQQEPPKSNLPQRPNAPLSQMIQWFKTMTTNEYIRGIKELDWKPSAGKLWQRNYFEHIIRNEKEMARIWNYIEANPAQWEMDEENPNKI